MDLSILSQYISPDILRALQGIKFQAENSPLPKAPPNPYSAPVMDPYAEKKFDRDSLIQITPPPDYLGENGTWNFNPPPPQYGLLPPPRSLVSPWDSLQNTDRTWTNVYGQQFTTPQQIDLSRFSSTPGDAMGLYMDQGIANVLSGALGF